MAAKEVILMEDVPGLGYTGDLVRVSPGYARNYLLPRNLAAPANDANKKRVEKRRVEAEQRRGSQREAMVQLAAKLGGLDLPITMKAGHEGKLFGSVTPMDISDALKKLGHAVEKQQVVLAEPIKTLGDYKVDVRLMPDVRASITVKVIEG